MPVGAEGEDVRRLAAEQAREFGRGVHALALGEVDQDHVDAGIGGERRAGDAVGAVLLLGEQGRLPVRGDLGEGVDGGAAGGVVERRGVGVDRDEQVGVEPPGDLVALVEPG